MAQQQQETGEQAPQQCEVCRDKAAKYTCPRCSRRTCSLECVKAHKEASGCSGKRDRTAFVGRAEFDERTFLSDYRFLEEMKLADDVAKRSKPPAPKLELPQFLQTLMYQARRRGAQLHILSPGMEKRRTNSTRYDGRMQLLQWHVEWSFPAAGCKAADTKVHENTVMAELLRGHLSLKPGAAARHHALRQYNEAGLEQLTVLLRKERTPANAVQYYEIDVSRPLRQQLAGKVIVEFPTFLVLLPGERQDYNILPAEAFAAAAEAAATTAAPAGATPAAAVLDQEGPQHDGAGATAGQAAVAAPTAAAASQQAADLAAAAGRPPLAGITAVPAAEVPGRADLQAWAAPSATSGAAAPAAAAAANGEAS